MDPIQSISSQWSDWESMTFDQSKHKKITKVALRTLNTNGNIPSLEIRVSAQVTVGKITWNLSGTYTDLMPGREQFSSYVTECIKSWENELKENAEKYLKFVSEKTGENLNNIQSFSMSKTSEAALELSYKDKSGEEFTQFVFLQDSSHIFQSLQIRNLYGTQRSMALSSTTNTPSSIRSTWYEEETKEETPLEIETDEKHRDQRFSSIEEALEFLKAESQTSQFPSLFIGERVTCYLQSAFLLFATEPDLRRKLIASNSSMKEILQNFEEALKANSPKFSIEGFFDLIPELIRGQQEDAGAVLLSPKIFGNILNEIQSTIQFVKPQNPDHQDFVSLEERVSSQQIPTLPYLTVRFNEEEKPDFLNMIHSKFESEEFVALERNGIPMQQTLIRSIYAKAPDHIFTAVDRSEVVHGKQNELQNPDTFTLTKGKHYATGEELSTYTLQSFIKYVGNGASGHYSVYFRKPGENGSPDTFWCYDNALRDLDQINALEKQPLSDSAFTLGFTKASLRPVQYTVTEEESGPFLVEYLDEKTFYEQAQGAYFLLHKKTAVSQDDFLS